MGQRGGLFASIHLRQLFQESRLTLSTVNQVMENITRSIRAVIRTHGEEGSSENLQGHVWVTTTCVYVRWLWVTFPIVTICLAGTFLVLVIFENRGIARDRL